MIPLSRLRRGTDESYDAPWLITFSDLLFLLLTGFVMRLSMSAVSDPGLFVSARTQEKQIEERKSDALILGKALVKDLRQSVGDPSVADEETITVQFGNEVALTLEETGVRLRLSEGSFLSGSREVQPEQRHLLKSVAESLRSKDVAIVVEGHTDDVPIATMQFPSNWDLSAARAISVAQILASNGLDPRFISAVGYGQTRPLAPNDTDENRALNRRVEIFVQQKPEESGDKPRAAVEAHSKG